MKKRWLDVLFKCFTFLNIFVFSVTAFAINGRTTYQARIVKPNGYPLESASVNFRFSVLDQSGSCILYVEDFSNINMTDTAGVISFPLGTGIRSFPTSGTSQTFQNTFDNSIVSFACQTVGIYNPNPTDSRKVVMQFNDGVGWQTLPAMTMNAVPYAMFATKSVNSTSLNGKADTDFVEVSTLAGLGCAADQAIKFNGGSFSCISVGVSATPVTSSAVIAALGYTPATGTSFTSLNSSITSVSSSVYAVESALTSLTNSVVASFTAISGVGISTFNGSTSATQSLNTGVAGTAPAFVTAAGVHTLNIPFASAGATTAGLISNSDYSLFSTVISKITSSAASIAQVLGYTPADQAQLTTLSSTVSSVSSSVSSLNSDIAAVSSTLNSLSTAVSGIVSSQWTTTGSNIYFNSGNAGVGVTNPTAGKLTISKTTAAASYALDITGSDPNVGSVNRVVNVNMSAGQVNQANTGIYLHNANQGDGSSIGVDLNLNNRNDSIGYKVSATKYWNSALFGTVAGVYATVGTDSSLANSYGGYFNNTASAGASAYGLYVNSVSGATDAAPLVIAAQSTEVFRVSVSGNVGVGTALPNARVHLAAGSTSRAPLKFTSGTLVSSPQAGSVEYDGYNLYLTDGANTRYQLVGTPTPGIYDSVTALANSSGNILLYPGAGTVTVSASTVSTNSNTGALVVKGGVGVAGALNVAGIISSSALVKASGFRANQGAPDNVDSSTNGYAFGDDGDTGIFSPGSVGAANGVVAIYNNNSETMRVTSSGVAIGTTNPQAKLQLGLSNWIGFEPQQGTTGLYFNEVGSMSASGLLTTHGARLFYDGTSDLLRLTTIEGSVELPALNIARTTGYVGIGTTAPISPLEVSGVAYASAFGFNRIASAPGNGIYAPAGNTFAISTNSLERLVINSGGYVGMGTTNPLVQLHVKSATSNTQIRIEGAPAAAQAEYYAIANGISWVTGTGVGNLGSQNYGIYNSVMAGNAMTFTASGHVGIGTNSPSTVGTYNHASGTKILNLSNAGNSVFNITGATADLSLYDNDGTANNRWHIIRNDSDKLQFVPHADNGSSKGAALTILNSSGLVGIGTTNPTAKLQVEGGEILVNLDNTAGILGGLSLTGKDADSGTPNMNRWSMYAMSDYSGANGLAFYEYYDADNDGSVCDDAGACSQRFIIAKGGNVGIGTTGTPTSKLEVRGGDTFMEGRAYVYSNSGWGSIVPGISLAVGDNDTGLNWVSDGVLQIYSNNQPRMHFAVGGAVGVNRTDPTYNLDVNGTFRVTGQAYTDTGAATFTVLSDARYKDVHGQFDRGLEELLKIGTVRYNYKKQNPTGADSTHEYVGVLAQNVQENIPEAVEKQVKDGKEFLTVNPSPIIFAMLNGFRDMYAKVVQLMDNDARIEREMASLKSENEELKNKAKEFDELKAYICKKDPQAPNCK